MARGTDFGGIHSHRDLHLVQALVEVDPAEPKLNFIDIPGADGAKDFTDLPAGITTYNTRKITWTFKLYPGDNWATKYRQVSNALNGRSCNITLDDDPDYYYVGRVAVDKHAVDGILHTITVVATCQPYKLKQEQTSVGAAISTKDTTLHLANERKPVIPEIYNTTDAILTWRGNSYSLSEVTGDLHQLLDIVLTEGDNTIQARTVSGDGVIYFFYREGAL